MTQIETLRLRGVQATAGVTFASALILLGTSAVLGGLVYGLVGAALAVVPVGFALTRRYDTPARVALGATLPVYAALFVAVAGETAWMLDMHMLFFAYLAMVAIMADWRAIIAATVMTALHHLILNFAAPALVFPEGASFVRVLLHAGIVVMETAVLVLLVSRIESLVVGLAQVREEQTEQEEKLAREREAINAEQRQALDAFKVQLGALSQGDLTVSVNNLPETYREFEDNFNTSVGSLDSAIDDVIHGIRAMNTGSMEISSASNDLARRTEAQAANLEETAAAIADANTRIHQTAEETTGARTTIASTTQKADDGSKIVTEAMNAMDQIEQSSAEINNIISVIESIAFQTNLLALNAGVEAARAGETGKGFAVVASEVRALAQRCTEAADEVKSLISASGQHVSSGVELVNRTGEAFAAINEDVSQLAASINAIAESTDIQASSISQITATVRDLDNSTQQNAAMAEECTAAAASLTSEAEGLARAVSHFQTGSAVEAGVDSMNPSSTTALAA
ncbi:MAG: methyl-accepting chemotaxis protein [Pseudomonadota bacterium]